MTTVYPTREQWLEEASRLLEPILRQGDVSVPSVVKVSVGWPSRRALSGRKRRIGECWPAEANKDGLNHIFVSPCLDDAVDVLHTLLHELIHAALPATVKHGRAFAKAAKACGLDGKPTATVPGEALLARLNAEVIPALGLYPHGAIDASRKEKKQTTRLRKWTCPCGQIARVANDHWHATCNDCSGVYVQETTNDRED